MGKKILVGYHYETQLTGYTTEPIYGRVTTSSNKASTKTEISSSSSSGQTTTMRSVTDDGLGGFFDGLGLVDYASKSIIIKTAGDFSSTSYHTNHENSSSWDSLNSGGAGEGGLAPSAGGGGSASASGGEYGSSSFRETCGSSILVRYKTGVPASVDIVENFVPPAIQIDLLPGTDEAIVPGSLQFTWMGVTYMDFEGYIYRGRTTTNPGIKSGVVDYHAGLLVMSDYVVGSNPFGINIQSMFTNRPPAHIATLTFNTVQAPVKPGGLIVSVVDITGEQLIATCDNDGYITGPHTKGVIDYESGSVEMQFGDLVTEALLTDAQRAEWWYNAEDIVDAKIWKPWPVYPSTLRYDVVSYTYLPLDAGVLGLDPVRLPSDGRVPIFKKAGVVVVHHTDAYTMPMPATANTTYSVGQTDVAEMWLVDSAGVKVPTAQYTTDLPTGQITLAGTFTIGSLQEPLLVKYRLEDTALVTDVQINGTLTLANPVAHSYPANTSYVSSAILFGDLNARTTNVFDLQTFAGWSDIAGTGASAQFNNIDYPILVVNEGAVTERWRLNFTSPTSFQVIGENLGVIEVSPGSFLGSTSVDCTPVNKLTGKPYFQLSAAGWGAGWASGNQLRFNTVSASSPIWIARTILPGATLGGDSFSMQLRGDVDLTV